MAHRQRIHGALDTLLQQERTWTGAQLAEALREQGIALSTRQTRRYLKDQGARWRRTARSRCHKQDPKLVAQAQQELTVLRPLRAN